MNILDLFSLQGTLFGIMLVGAILKKRRIIDESGKRCLTDICVNAIIAWWQFISVFSLWSRRFSFRK